MPMKNYFVILCFLLTHMLSWAQAHGNEWIDFSQKYYGFKIHQTGLYRIDYTTLQNNNIPITGINPASFQLFGKDKEIPLYMVDNGDLSFDPGEYFLFYAS